jgi:hypothetical protein
MATDTIRQDIFPQNLDPGGILNPVEPVQRGNQIFLEI